MLDELVSEILNFLSIPLGFPVAYLPASDLNYNALQSCSLVCKRWSTHAQRLLFRRVIIDNSSYPDGCLTVETRRRFKLPIALARRIGWQPRINPILSFLKTITAGTGKSHWLCRQVLSLGLHYHASTTPTDILAILTNLPHLCELVIGRVPSFSDADLVLLRRMGPSIRSLHIRRDVAPGSPAFRLIAAIPTLRILNILLNDWPSAPSPVIHEIPDHVPPLGLCVLSFNCMSIGGPTVGPLLTSLANGRADSQGLEVFYYRHFGPGKMHLGQVLAAHGSHIRSLLVEGLINDAHVLSCCTNLERFESNFLTEDIMAAIPRTINTLAIPFFAGDHPQSSSSLAPPDISIVHLTQQLDSFPMLRVLILKSSEREFAALRNRCIELGIQLRYRRPIQLSDDAIQFELRSRLLKI
ncbi:hypothetical protein C8R45DRAFT_971202 [Mycena sanguinolenta]|nr:hypothetical protein C8R45DRAFT_971202 [Mycena sanguinolenta]